MRKISKKVLEKVLARPGICQREHEGGCQGRMTLEHALIYGSKQIDEAWAIVKLCAYHHAVDEFQDGGDLQKEVNVWIALNQATPSELLRYSKAINYQRLKENLNNKYGIYHQPR